MENVVVETRYGKVKGERTGNVSVWKGIPYAKPPVGKLRFRPPESLEAWNGVYDATSFGAVAMQPESPLMSVLEGGDHVDMSEDCLNLNIWSPAADGKRRPVMVWVHGGAFMNGAGSSEIYDGTSFATNGDVVVVTLNYRLGVMGFLHLEDEQYAASGNCGILDQIEALKWVKENIEAFGGDPEQITIFGESAGAMSIGILLAIPAVKGLFHQAILQSGAARNVLTTERATRVTTKVLRNLGIDSGDLSRLGDIPAEEILQAAKDIPPMALGPVMDGYVIPEHPETLLAKGASKDVPILIGTNKDEYRLFTFFDLTWQQIDEAEIKRRLHKMFGPLWQKIQAELAGQTLNQQLFERLMSTHVFTFPAIRLAELKLHENAQVWMYRFDWESPVFGGGLKSSHAMEIPFVWDNLDKQGMEALIGDAPDQHMAEQMHQAWIAFAHHGNPNHSDLPDWKPYDTENRTTMIFNTESKLVNDPNQAERHIFE
ncbi:carboxylesterase/lipase family protein [Lentibacillus sp. N15]|uniref:carboxylesterase/lipase family protein n=1 Tax=Lentibacillus songyuanensis TaxID=3136161 RepID=UPI0031BB6671